MASVRKRNRIYKGEVKSSWEVSWTDHGGKRRAKQFKMKKAADRHRTKVETEIEGGYHVAEAASITVREAGTKWLEVCELRMKLDDNMTRHTFETYRRTIDNHVYPSLGTVKLSHLTAPMVQKWVYEMVQHPTEPRSCITIRKALACLRMLLAEAQRQGRIAHNIVRDAPPRVPGRTKERIEIPTRAELKMMLGSAEGSMRVILYAAVFTGMRQGELRALTWEHVDFAQGIVRVRQSADRWGGFGRPKSRAGVRDIPMAPVLAKMLKEWKLACRVNDLGLVFPNTCGNVVTITNLHLYRWRPFMKSVGLVDETTGVPKYHFHALRHCAASLFIEQGLPPKQVQTIMGHATMAMTFDVYGHLFKDDAPAHAAMAAIELNLLG